MNIIAWCGDLITSFACAWKAKVGTIIGTVVPVQLKMGYGRGLEHTYNRRVLPTPFLWSGLKGHVIGPPGRLPPD